MDLGLDIRDLAKMFNELDPQQLQNETIVESDSDIEDHETKTNKHLVKGPGDIAATSGDVKVKSSNKKKESDIWDEKDAVNRTVHKENMLDNDNISIKNDPRQTPSYEMHYRQSVTTEDIYLQMGNKMPGSANCENLIVQIHLPQDDFNNMQLNIKKQAIDLRSPIHFLYLNLPHPINPRAGNAKWDREKEKLIITLHLAEFNLCCKS